MTTQQPKTTITTTTTTKRPTKGAAATGAAKKTPTQRSTRRGDFIQTQVVFPSDDDDYDNDDNEGEVLSQISGGEDGEEIVYENVVVEAEEVEDADGSTGDDNGNADDDDDDDNIPALTALYAGKRSGVAPLTPATRTRTKTTTSGSATKKTPRNQIPPTPSASSGSEKEDAGDASSQSVQASIPSGEDGDDAREEEEEEESPAPRTAKTRGGGGGKKKKGASGDAPDEIDDKTKVPKGFFKTNIVQEEGDGWVIYETRKKNLDWALTGSESMVLHPKWLKIYRGCEYCGINNKLTARNDGKPVCRFYLQRNNWRSHCKAKHPDVVLPEPTKKKKNNNASTAEDREGDEAVTAPRSKSTKSTAVQKTGSRSSGTKPSPSPSKTQAKTKPATTTTTTTAGAVTSTATKKRKRAAADDEEEKDDDEEDGGRARTTGGGGGGGAATTKKPAPKKKRRTSSDSTSHSDRYTHLLAITEDSRKKTKQMDKLINLLHEQSKIWNKQSDALTTLASAIATSAKIETVQALSTSLPICVPLIAPTPTPVPKDVGSADPVVDETMEADMAPVDAGGDTKESNDIVSGDSTVTGPIISTSEMIDTTRVIAVVESTKEISTVQQPPNNNEDDDVEAVKGKMFASASSDEEPENGGRVDSRSVSKSVDSDAAALQTQRLAQSMQAGGKKTTTIVTSPPPPDEGGLVIEYGTKASRNNTTATTATTATAAFAMVYFFPLHIKIYPRYPPLMISSQLFPQSNHFPLRSLEGFVHIAKGLFLTGYLTLPLRHCLVAIGDRFQQSLVVLLGNINVLLQVGHLLLGILDPISSSFGFWFVGGKNKGVMRRGGVRQRVFGCVQRCGDDDRLCRKLPSFLLPVRASCNCCTSAFFSPINPSHSAAISASSTRIVSMTSAWSCSIRAMSASTGRGRGGRSCGRVVSVSGRSPEGVSAAATAAYIPSFRSLTMACCRSSHHCTCVDAMVSLQAFCKIVSSPRNRSRCSAIN